MSAMTPPSRVSLDRERQTPTPTPTPTSSGRYSRPSFIPLPTSLAAPAFRGSEYGLSSESRSRSSSFSQIPAPSRTLMPSNISHSSALGLGSLVEDGRNGNAAAACDNASNSSLSSSGSATVAASRASTTYSAMPADEESDDAQRVLPVKVAVRVRPLSTDTSMGATRGALSSCVEMLPRASVRVTPSGEIPGTTPRNFAFDYAFGPDSQQISIFETAVAPLLARFAEGYNVTVLAYGQTSSGKTFTMGTDANDLAHGTESDAGVVPRSLSWLFSWIRAQPAGSTDVRVSFVEVYNDELIDLVALAQYGGVRPPVFVREDSRGNIQWTGVKEVTVAAAADAMALLAAGSRERQTSSTRMNGRSSRSHAIFSLALSQTRMRSAAGPVRIESKLHFVDLAGSERLKKTMAEGDRKREGIAINSGLLALGNVISALGDPARSGHAHVPYRDSKLTHMLRDSLGGSALTLLVACVSPAEAQAAETLNTLKYAARARNIKNCGGVNVVAASAPSPAEVQALRAQVRRLRSQVRSLEDRLQARALDERPDERPASELRMSHSSLGHTPAAPRGLLSPPSRIPGIGAGTSAASVQRRVQAAEELATLRVRNQSLESELEQLNDTYTELLLKFNDACREIEERQSEGFARDRRLRDREQELRRLTGHSRHSRRVASVIGEGDTRPSSVADTLRLKRRSVRAGTPTLNEDGARDSTAMLDGDAPGLPDLTRLRSLQQAEATNDAAPGAAEFDAMLEEYDINVRALEAELQSSRDAIEGLRMQLSMQETKATYAERLNASQATQIESLRTQLTRAREAGLEEEERRRAIEAELEEAAITAETRFDAADAAWRQELSQADALWTERWEAVHAEHSQALAAQTAEIAHLRRQLAEAATPTTPHQMLSPPPTAGDYEGGMRGVNNQKLELVVAPSDTDADHASMRHQLEADLAQSLETVRALQAELEEARSQALDAEARASAAESALAALSSRLAEQSSADRKEIDDLSRLLAEQESDSQKELDALTARLAEQRREAEVRVVAAETKAEIAEAQIADSEARVADAEAQVVDSEARAADAEARVIAAEAQAADLRAQIAKAEAQATDLEARVSAAETQAAAAAAAETLVSAAKDHSALAEPQSISEIARLPTPRDSVDCGVQTETPAMADKALQHVFADPDAPRRTASSKIVLCARNSTALREPSAESPAEIRLRGMRHRNSMATPSTRMATPPAQMAASYPELRLAEPIPTYNEEGVQDMLRAAAAEIDRQADNDNEKRAMAAELTAAKAAKKDLQERNSQLQNLLRELGDRLVALAEENDQLEARAAERDELAAEIEQLRHQLALASDERPVSRALSFKSFHSAAEDQVPPMVDAAAAASYDILQLQARLGIAEAELSEAMLSAEEHSTRAAQLAHELEEQVARAAALEEDVTAAVRELDEARDDLRLQTEQMESRAADAAAELAKQTALVTCLRESLALSEEHVEEARLTADRYANELLRVQADAKNALEQASSMRAQLEETRSMVASEARDRDIWKGRCQDLREEVEQLRSRRRQSKILCF
ncbi:hypothetical protein GGI07_001996 [Coemansia sp. Benny D115]|nr:hypothetical protein GGI07_001996 [Coemansia sp. Benny D115]